MFESQPPPTRKPANPVLYYTIDQVANMLGTTTRTIFTWVAQGRFPEPLKFGKMSRWPKAQVDAIFEQGVKPEGQGVDLLHIPHTGINLVCAHCGGGLLLHRSGIAEKTTPPPVVEEPVPEATPKAKVKKKPAAKKPARKKRTET